MLLANKWEEQGIYIQHEGIVSAKDMLDSDRNYGDSRFDDITYILVDLLLVTGFSFDRRDLKLKAEQSNVAVDWNDRIKLIFVISDSDIKKEIEYYVDQMKKGKNKWDLYIVPSIQEARTIISK